MINQILKTLMLGAIAAPLVVGGAFAKGQGNDNAPGDKGKGKYVEEFQPQTVVNARGDNAEAPGDKHRNGK